ncbi:LacI family DNA-binding transcriptional regulator [Streptomyces griseolus]|nr:LacI family DNA-binding transcriptional regulator [Streptomyces griseolus]MCW8220074.1 LacI family DNA-binding transcriptional regulator [Streptomyces griseolus]
MSVSIGDVARLAGVSRTTVSHVISGKRPVSDAVEDRVRSAMTELGYAPSRMAQNLASGTTRTMGLLVPDIGNGFFADIAKGVERTAIAGGYNMLLCNTGWNLERELFYLETLKSRAVDGVVYAAGVPAATSQLTGLLGGLPVVAVDEELWPPSTWQHWATPARWWRAPPPGWPPAGCGSRASATPGSNGPAGHRWWPRGPSRWPVDTGWPRSTWARWATVRSPRSSASTTWWPSA